MYDIKNFHTGNKNIKLIEDLGCFSIIEHLQDMSVTPQQAMFEYFASKMDCRKRQVVCQLDGSKPVIIQRGAMQWMLGNVKATTGIKGAGDLIGKAFRGKVTGEDAIKPEYTGEGVLVLEPTYKHLALFDIKDWNGAVVLDDGIFAACEGTLKQSVVARSNFSSAVAGGEGLFNLCLKGTGVFAVELNCPKEELIEIILDNDVLKIDGNYAVAWSNTLDFTVEKSTKSLLGSAASGEGLVNVYRGTGRVLMQPIP